MKQFKDIIDLIRAKLSNSENRDLANNTLALTILNVFNFILPLFTIPILLNNLGANSYGRVSVIISIYAILDKVVDYGFDFIGTRNISIAENQEKRNIVFSEILLCKIANAILVIVLSLLYFILFRSDDFVLATVISSGLLGTALCMNWLFQGLKRMKVITYITSITKVIYSILVILLIRDSGDSLLYAFLYSFITISIGVLGFLIAISRPYRLKFSRISIKSIYSSYKEGWHMFVASLCSSITTNLCTIVLSLFRGDAAVGFFSAGYKLVQALSLVFSAIPKALYPYSCVKFKESFENGKKYVYKVMKPVLLLIGVACLFLSLMSPWIFRWIYDPVYWPFYPIVIIGSAWLFFSFLNNFLGIQILVASGNSSKYRLVFTWATIITVLALFICICLGGEYGTIIALLLGECSLSLLLKKQINKTNNALQV